jgi:hypothetical protein
VGRGLSTGTDMLCRLRMKECLVLGYWTRACWTSSTLVGCGRTINSAAYDSKKFRLIYFSNINSNYSFVGDQSSSQSVLLFLCCQYRDEYMLHVSPQLYTSVAVGLSQTPEKILHKIFAGILFTSVQITPGCHPVKDSRRKECIRLNS